MICDAKDLRVVTPEMPSSGGSVMPRVMTDGSLHNFWQPKAEFATTEYNESLYGDGE